MRKKTDTKRIILTSSFVDEDNLLSDGEDERLDCQILFLDLQK